MDFLLRPTKILQAHLPKGAGRSEIQLLQLIKG